MARRLLINAIHPEEKWVAIAENDKLIELESEREDQAQLKGNIYKAQITRIEPSLQAAFLDIGANRNGFLQINDIHSAYFNNWPPKDQPKVRFTPPIQEVLSAGQHLVVQIVKDERDAKGATLTTNLSIPGRYLVLMVGNQRGGVSRKIVDEVQRRRLKHAIQNLRVPPGMGVIVRTAGLNKGSCELQRDLDGLIQIWKTIVERSLKPGSPKILYKESDLAIRAIRDYVRSSFDEILIDEAKTHADAYEFVKRIIPSMQDKVLLFDKPGPIFAHFGLEQQVQMAGQSSVTLPSGGSIVINVTEAVVAVDVNSGRSTQQSDVEETAFNTNKEAAETIARHLRLRDLGGLIVIDFIDMTDRRHKQVVEKTLKDAVRSDRAKVEVGRISKFGLLEMSRQRLKSSLTAQNHIKCPHCKGRGILKTADSTALEALKKVHSAVGVGGIKVVRLHMAPSAALYLLNEKREFLSKLEESSGSKIRIYADSRLPIEDYQLILDTSKPEAERTAEPKQEEVARPSSRQRPGRTQAPPNKNRRGNSRRTSRNSRGSGARGQHRNTDRAAGAGASEKQSAATNGAHPPETAETKPQQSDKAIVNSPPPKKEEAAMPLGKAAAQGKTRGASDLD